MKYPNSSRTMEMRKKRKVTIEQQRMSKASQEADQCTKISFQ